jgi:EpsI family protein
MSPARFLLLAGILLASAAATVAIGGNPISPAGYRGLRMPFSEFPLTIGGYRGRDIPLAEKARELVGMDRYLQREYHPIPGGPEGPAPGGSLLFYVSYHGNKARGLEAIYHNPTVCLPAAGWDWVDSRRKSVTLADLAMEFEVSLDLFRHRRSGREKVVLNFFVVEERRAVGGTPRNQPFWVGLERLRSGDGPGYLAQIQVVRDVNGTREDAERRVLEFLRRAGGRILLHF